MLVLNRSPRKGEQELHIGNDVIVTVLRVIGETVTIGITAPKEIPVLREELLEEKPLEVTRQDMEC
jgi:carbon storage regulator